MELKSGEIILKTELHLMDGSMGTLHYIPAAGPEWAKHETAIFDGLHAALLRDGHELHCVRGVTQEGVPYWMIRESRGHRMVRVMRTNRRYVVYSQELGLSARALDLAAALAPIRDRWTAKKAWNEVGSAI
jgi:hypothetical protein